MKDNQEMGTESEINEFLNCVKPSLKQMALWEYSGQYAEKKYFCSPRSRPVDMLGWLHEVKSRVLRSDETIFIQRQTTRINQQTLILNYTKKEYSGFLENGSTVSEISIVNWFP